MFTAVSTYVRTFEPQLWFLKSLQFQPRSPYFPPRIAVNCVCSSSMAINEKSILVCRMFQHGQRNQWNRRPYVYFTGTAANNRQTGAIIPLQRTLNYLSLRKILDTAKWSVLGGFLGNELSFKLSMDFVVDHRALNWLPSSQYLLYWLDAH